MKRIIAAAVSLLVLIPSIRAQEDERVPVTPEEKEKKMVEYIEKDLFTCANIFSGRLWPRC